MTPIPVPVRLRILALYARGQTTAAIADALGYCVAAVRRVRQHARERGTVEPATGRCGRTSGLTDDVRAAVLRAHAARTDATLAELSGALAAADPPVVASTSTLDRWLRGPLGVTHEKRRRTPPSRPGPTSRRPGPPGRRPSRPRAAGT